jgi:hypothetical protein
MIGRRRAWPPTLALVGRASCPDGDQEDSTLAPWWLLADEARGETPLSRPQGRGTRPGSTSVDVAGRAAATNRLQKMSSSCRCSPPLPAAPAWSCRRRPGPATAKPSAVAPYHLATVLAGAWPPSASLFRPRLTSFISQLASCEVPGFRGTSAPVGPRPRSPCVRPGNREGRRHLSIRPAVAKSCLRRHGNPAGDPGAEKWPSLPYKGTRGARIVSARKGELMESFRGAQVRMGASAIRIDG